MLVSEAIQTKMSQIVEKPKNKKKSSFQLRLRGGGLNFSDFPQIQITEIWYREGYIKNLNRLILYNLGSTILFQKMFVGI